MILVTGGTGRVGREVVRNLLDYEAAFKVLSRDPRRVAMLWPDEDVPVVKGDFQDPQSLQNAMKGMDKVFLSSPAGLRMEEFQSNLIEAADSAGIVQVVKLSAMGANLDSPIRLCRMHRRIEERLERSDMAWTHLRPNFFFNSIIKHQKTMRGESKIYAPARDGKASMIDVRDVALVASYALTEDGHEGRTYELTGKEALSYADVARTISTITGTTITYQNIPGDDARRRMIDDGMSEWLADDHLGLYRIWAGNDAALVTRTVFDVTHKTPNTFWQFVLDYDDDFYFKKVAATG